jgi:1,4-dihydroxy-2-naphthoate octaprenyltransferase
MLLSEESKFYLAVLKPWELLFNLVFYFLGAGLANYLGNEVDWRYFWVGFIVMAAILIGGSALAACYRQISQGHSLKNTVSNTLPGTPQAAGRKRLLNCMMVMVVSFGIALILVIQIILNDDIPQQVILFLVLAIIFISIYSIPPFRLAERGFSEFTWSIEGAFLIPVVGFLIQQGTLNKLLVFICVPLALFYLVMELTRSLRPYALDPGRYKRDTLVGKIGPKQGLNVIISLIPAAYLIAGLESFFGLSWSVLWRILITLPIGIFLIWNLQRIREGAKPNWQVLELTSIALAVFPAYFISIWFWAG